jgi:NAD-dependent DNA ligase
VIPHIFEVLESLSSQVEENDCLKDINCSYKWSKNKVDLICVEKDNFQSIIKQNVLFFKSLELKCNLQEKTLLNVYNSIGKYHLKDILSLSLEDWIKVDKTGEKKATGILNALYDVLHWSALTEQKDFDCMEYYLKLCVGLQCFERGFAYKKIKLYIEYLSELTFIDMKQCYKNDYIESKKTEIIQSVSSNVPKQITCVTMTLFLDGMQNMNNKMNAVYQANTPFTFVSMETLLEKIIEESGASNHVMGEQYEFVFSGFRPSSTFIKDFEKKGGKIVNDVSKKTTALIVKDKQVNPTKKMQNAIKWGVSIFEIDEFINSFKQYKDITLV